MLNDQLSLSVFLAHPSDVIGELLRVERAIRNVNSILFPQGVTLQQFEWRIDAIPAPGRAQENLNHVLDNADIVVVILRHQLGEGTREELDRALERFKETRHPWVMVYFYRGSAPPASTRSDHDERWRVSELYKSLSSGNELLPWEYSDIEQFGPLIERHLLKHVTKNIIPQIAASARPTALPASPPASEPAITSPLQVEPTTLEAFEPPSFPDSVVREYLLDECSKLAGEGAALALEGLAGSGKTYLAASFVAQALAIGKYQHCIWYDPQEKESLDDLIAALAVPLQLSGSSVAARCKSLMRRLETTNSLLVIEDYHRINATSYKTLIASAARTGKTARLLLTSRTFIDSIRVSSYVKILELGGLTIDELASLLRTRGTDAIDESSLEELLKKTGGLPFAASLFATLVKDFGRSPLALLRGDMLESVRLNQWFTELMDEFGQEEDRLLQALSLLDEPFNIGFVKVAARVTQVSQSTKTFEMIQRAYLIRNHTFYRWTVHSLVGTFALKRLSRSHRRAINRAFGHWCTRGITLRPQHLLTHDEFQWLMRGIRHFLRSGNRKQVDRLLEVMARTAKFHGYFDTYVRAAGEHLHQYQHASEWVRYHYAHCCLMTGRLDEAERISHDLLFRLSEDLSTNEALAFVRLRAEILCTLGKPETAHKLLKEQLDQVREGAVRSTTYRQAHSIMAWILRHLERFEDALNVAQTCLVESEKANDSVGAAVAMCRCGYCLLSLANLVDALEYFKVSKSMFQAESIERGVAWASVGVALALAEKNDFDSAIRELRTVLKQSSEANECSVDYYRSLKSLVTYDVIREALPITAELKRVSSVFEISF